MDDHDSSSSGLMIGMIAGGAVVLILIVLGILGAGFFLVSDHEVAMPPMPVAARPAPAPLDPVPPAVEPAPQPGPDGAARTRLIGVWEVKTLDDTQATLDLRGDGSMELIAQVEGKASTRTGRWELLEAQGDRMKLRRTNADNTDTVQDIVFQGPDRFIVQGVGGGAIYTRKPGVAK